MARRIPAVRTRFGDGQASGPTLEETRVSARIWARQIDDRRRQAAAWSFTAEAVRAYVEAQGHALERPPGVSPLELALTHRLDSWSAGLARHLGRLAAVLPPVLASYQLSATYAALLPSQIRTERGTFYTPPPLANRLLDMAVEAGTDWARARVLDPACGGGAFLVPVALRMRAALPGLSARAFLEHLRFHLRGFEIDPFAAWLSQAWLEITFAREIEAAGTPFPAIVELCDSIEREIPAEKFNLVVGNPPFGRVTLTPEQRRRFGRSLFGHANLYGVFTDLALHWTEGGGVLALVTPTSFLAGGYYKNLRATLAREAALLALDFVNARRGIFEDVLQETALTTYRRGGARTKPIVHYLSVSSEGAASLAQAGWFTLPSEPVAPWVAPREPGHQPLIDRLARMPTRLADWGYEVSTGPLVWNRFKGQLRSEPSEGTFPLIWAEAVNPPGRFVFRADKRNHVPYFHARPADEWLKIKTACVLVQRTTAKEQPRRLIAAELPPDFVARHGAVIVENHLNMVRPLRQPPRVTPAALAAVLNSAPVDEAFRCMSGSVAVSAFELEALPLPDPEAMGEIEELLARGAATATIELTLNRIYRGQNT